MLTTRTMHQLWTKRTLRPLIWNHGIYPSSAFYDPVSIGCKIVYPGMVATKTVIETVGIGTDLDEPIGLFANFINGPLDELGDTTEVGIWPLSGTFEVLAGPTMVESPLSHEINWEISGNCLLYANSVGQLTIDPGDHGAYSLGKVISGGHDRIEVELSAPEADPYMIGYQGQYRPDLIGNPDYLMGQLDSEGDRKLWAMSELYG